MGEEEAVKAPPGSSKLLASFQWGGREKERERERDEPSPLKVIIGTMSLTMREDRVKSIVALVGWLVAGQGVWPNSRGPIRPAISAPSDSSSRAPVGVHGQRLEKPPANKASDCPTMRVQSQSGNPAHTHQKGTPRSAVFCFLCFFCFLFSFFVCPPIDFLCLSVFFIFFVFFPMQFGSDFSDREPGRKLIGSVIFGFSVFFGLSRSPRLPWRNLIVEKSYPNRL